MTLSVQNLSGWKECSVSTVTWPNPPRMDTRRFYNALTNNDKRLAMPFEDFTPFRVAAGDADIFGVKGGAGPPLLLLHGHPETHLIWDRCAAQLAKHFTVIATDPRGLFETCDGGRPGGRDAPLRLRPLSGLRPRPRRAGGAPDGARSSGCG